MTHLLDGLPDPKNTPDSQFHTGPDKRLIRKIKTYGIEDPPVKREKSTPPGIIHSIVAAATSYYHPKNPACHRLFTIGVLLLTLVL